MPEKIGTHFAAPDLALAVTPAVLMEDASARKHIHVHVLEVHVLDVQVEVVLVRDFENEPATLKY